MLKGEKVYLRALEPDDASILYTWENDVDLWYLSNTLAPFSNFLIEEYLINSHQDIYSTKQLRLMVIDVNSNTTIGVIDLFDFDPHNLKAGVGILIDKKFRNKGFASDSLKILIKYAFNTLNLHQLYCNILIDNQASIKLFQQNGFIITGLKKEWIKINNSWSDEYILQLINI